MRHLAACFATALALLGAGHAARAEPFAYLSDQAGRQLVVIDTALKQVVARIPIAGVPGAIAIPPLGWLGYVLTDGNALTVIDIAGQRALGQVPLGNVAASDLAYNPVSGHLYFALPGIAPPPGGGAGQGPGVLIMASGTYAQVARISLSNTSCATLFDPNAPRAYLLDCVAPTVRVLDDNNFSVVSTFNNAAGVSGGSGMARSAADNRLYVLDQSANRVTVINPEGGTIVTSIAVGNGPTAIVMNPTGTRAFVRNAGSNDVSVIDIPSAQVIRTILGGAGASHLDITPDGQWLYVTRPAAGAVTVVSVDGLNTVADIPVPVGADAPGHFIGGAAQLPSHTPGILTGLWWNPAESGWGMHLAQRSNTIFAAWFTYDAAGAAKWYVASDCQVTPPLPCDTCVANAFCTGDLHEATGPAFFQGPFSPAAVNLTKVGLVQMTFQDADHGSVIWSVKGNVHSTPIERQVFRTGAIAGTNYTDLWFSALEAGWGMGVVQEADVMFLTWYVYDDGGAPLWLFASNCAVKSDGNGCSGKLYRTSGPSGPASGQAFDPSKVKVTEVGQIDVSFSDPNNGMVSYTVNGKSGTKAITRQLF